MGLFIFYYLSIANVVPTNQAQWVGDTWAKVKLHLRRGSGCKTRLSRAQNRSSGPSQVHLELLGHPRTYPRSLMTMAGEEHVVLMEVQRVKDYVFESLEPILLLQQNCTCRPDPEASK
nr:hypothetical protein Iba_chr12bCG12700 [Ipomoea batatas]